MAPQIGPDSRRVSQAECEVFRGASAASPVPAEPQVAGLAQQPIGSGDILPAQAGEQAAGKAGEEQEGVASTEPPMPVEEFVKQTFVGDIPVHQAELYKSDREKVEAMLVDPEFAPYRNNIIGLLAVIGGHETIPLLEQVIESPVVGRIAEDEKAAWFAAPIAIGVIANRLGLSESEIGTLREAANPGYWEQLLEAGATADPSEGALDRDDLEALSRDLAVQSTYGYALSGSAEAREHLEELQEGTARAAMPEGTRQESLAVYDQAIQLNEASSAQGALSIFTER